MKILFLKFEKYEIHLVEFDLDSKGLIFGEKESLSLNLCESQGERYKKILDELLQLKARFSPDIFCYHLPQKIMGKTNEERFANESMLHLFCFENQIKLESLYKPFVRQRLDISDKEFKTMVEKEKKKISQEQKISKSDKTLEGIAFLSLIKNIL